MKNFFKYFLLALILFPNFAISESAKFKFGISAPLSGILAEYGGAIKNGVELAIQDHQEEMRHIDLVFEDSQWDAKTAVSAFNLLRDVKKVQLIYNWGNPTSEAIAPLAKRLKFPVLAMSSDPKIAEGSDYLIRTVRSGAELGGLLGQYLDSKGYKKIEVVMAENSYVQGLYNGVKNEMAKKQSEVNLLGSFNLDTQDLKSIISRLKLKKFDALGIFLITGQIRTFYKQLAGQGIKVATFGADFFGSKSEIQASGKGIEGAVFPDLAVTDGFRERYLKKYGNDIYLAFAANAYDVVTLVAKNFSDLNAPILNSSDVISRLTKSAPVKGAHGEFYFEKNPQYGPAFVHDMVIKKIHNGEIVIE